MATKRARPAYAASNKPRAYKKRPLNSKMDIVDETIYYEGMTGTPRLNYSSVPRTRGGQVMGEMKYYDTQKNAVIKKITTTWDDTKNDPVGDSLFAPALGAAYNQRIGKSCKLLKIKMKGFINVPAAPIDEIAANGNILVRVLLVWDKQTNYAQMDGKDLLNPGADSHTTLMSFQKIDGFGRFVVLKDKIMNLSNINMIDHPTVAGQGYQMGVTRPFKFNHNFKVPAEVRFGATGGSTIADLTQDSFHIIAACTGTDAVPSIIYSCRCCFKE